MHGFLQWAARSAGLATLIVTAGCGGGGGGGDGGTTTPGPGGSSGTTFGAVSIALKSPDAIRDVTYEGLAPHQATLEISYAGDISALTGRTIYAKVVQPEAIYVADTTVSTGAGQSVTLSLFGSEQPALPVGHTTGTLQVYACLDPACATQLQNSPLSVDYDIEVKPAFVLSSASLQQSTSYGTALAPRTVTVTPPGDNPWYITPLTTPAGASAASLANLPAWLTRSGNTLTFQAPANLLPGTYAVEFQLDTVVPDGKFPSVPQRLVRKLLVSHTVVATGPFAITPASETLTASLSGLAPGTVIPEMVSQVGGTFSRRGVRTDAFPAAAASEPLLANWLTFDDGPNIGTAGHFINYCNRITLACLPIGTYRGALLMRHTGADGVLTDFEFPVTFTLTP